MTKKKHINKWWIILWLFLMYIWTYIFVVNTTDNSSVKDYTYINKVLAKLQFFQNQNQTTSYNTSSSVLGNWKWASPKYPLQSIYSTWVIVNITNPTPIPSITGSVVNPTTNTRYIYIRPPRRHSH